jgi:hypothetical protein
MAVTLQLEEALSATAQSVKDQNGNTSPLALSTDAVGIGTTTPGAKLDVQGEVRIANRGEGAVLLDLSSERSWSFRQLGTAQATALELASVGGGGNKNFIINTAGRVGIGAGITNPQEKLEVEGNIFATGDVILTGADCAEEFDIEEGQTLEPGTVMVISDEEKLCHCTEAYDSKVAGVLSGAGAYKPGIVLGKQQSQRKRKRMPLALTGKVYCKADAQYAAIKVGDLLTTSPTPGHAMKASDPSSAFGTILGKALQPLPQGQGLIPILVSLQ